MNAASALRRHWPEYLMEAAELGLFMMSACGCVALLEHPSSPLHRLGLEPWARRAVIGTAMGLTGATLVYSPLGKRSGAHFNPSVTLAFWRLGKIRSWDAIFYVAFQLVGAVAGVAMAAALLGVDVVGDASVHYVATAPGAYGSLVAFAAEAAISFGMMSLVLLASNNERLAPRTGMLTGLLVALYITIEAPLSGMSMNPARSFGPALVGGIWNGLWIYWIAPPLGMLAAAEVWLRGTRPTGCAKLHHRNRYRCIFCNP